METQSHNCSRCHHLVQARTRELTLRVLSTKKEGPKKEGNEKGKRERERENEVFEAERVVKLRLVQAETGEAGQLWKRVWGTLQVSPP